MFVAAFKIDGFYFERRSDSSHKNVSFLRAILLLPTMDVFGAECDAAPGYMLVLTHAVKKGHWSVPAARLRSRDSSVSVGKFGKPVVYLCVTIWGRSVYFEKYLIMENIKGRNLTHFIFSAASEQWVKKLMMPWWLDWKAPAWKWGLG